MMLNRLILGTASLGLENYGSKWPRENSFASRVSILSEMLNKGVTKIDVAARYGDAELLIGEIIKSGLAPGGLEIDTKIDNLDIALSNDQLKSQISRAFENSLERLQSDNIRTLYLHQHSLSLLSNEVVMGCLSKFKEEGRIKYIGASVYSHEELTFCLNSGVYDKIQVPLNAMNTSFAELADSNKLVARSIFAQGMLLNPQLIDKIKNEESKIHFYRFHNLCLKYNVDPLELTKWFVQTKFQGEYIFSSLKLNRLMSFVNNNDFSPSKEFRMELMELTDPEYCITNPRNW